MCTIRGIKQGSEMTIDIFAVALRIVQSIAVIAVKLASASLAIAISPRIKFHGPLFNAWVLGEVLSLVILTITFIDSFFALGYDLQPWENVVIQALKAVLWFMITLAGLIGLLATRPELHPKFTDPWIAALFAVL